MIRILFFLQSAFSLWMLVDALRRRCSSYWYLVVLFPFGEWFYFFKVKIHDPEFEGLRTWAANLFARRVTLDEHRSRYRQTPSFANQLTLAQALFDGGEFEEAAELFRGARDQRPKSMEALYGLALCEAETGRADEAVRHLEEVIATEPGLREYAAWMELARIHGAHERVDEALEVLDRLVRTSPRLSHRVTYAHCLNRAGRTGEAEAELRRAMLEYENAPRFYRRQARPWARKARRMMRGARRAAGAT